MRFLHGWRIGDPRRASFAVHPDPSEAYDLQCIGLEEKSAVFTGSFAVYPGDQYAQGQHGVVAKAPQSMGLGELFLLIMHFSYG